MNRKIYFCLLTIFLCPFNLQSMNKKRSRDSDTILPNAKRVKTTDQTLNSQQILAKREIEIDWSILNHISEKNIHALIHCSNWFIKNPLTYTTDLNTLARRMHNHHKLYLFFSKNNYPTYAQENKNLTRKYHYEWLKQSNMFS